MGKLIRNGIEYGGGNGTDIFKVTQAEYDALEQAGTLVHNALYVITDAPNLNATASDIEYSSGVSVADELNDKADKTAIPTLLTNDSYSINSLKIYGATSLTGDLNTLLTDGIYQVGNITAQSNAPTGVGYSGCIKVLHITSSYILQEAICDSGRKTRLTFDGGTTWGAWY